MMEKNAGYKCKDLHQTSCISTTHFVENGMQHLIGNDRYSNNVQTTDKHTSGIDRMASSCSQLNTKTGNVEAQPGHENHKLCKLILLSIFGIHHFNKEC